MFNYQSDKICFSVDDAAARLSISKRALYREISSGRLKFAKVGRRTLIAAAAIQEWIEAASQSAKTAA